MVSNHLRAPYGVYFTKTSYVYGASKAPSRRHDKSYVFDQIFRHRTVPGELRVLLKIPRRPYGVWYGHWGWNDTARSPDGVRPMFAHIGRAPDDFCSKFISYVSNGSRPGIVRCLTCARKNLLTNRPMFLSGSATGEKRRVFAEVHIAFT